MVLSYRIFQTMPFDQQLTMLWAHGRYLARRWGEDTVVLYALFGFFCEVHYDAETNTLLRTHSFLGTAGLEGYIAGIGLGELVEPGAEK